MTLFENKTTGIQLKKKSYSPLFNLIKSYRIFFRNWDDYGPKGRWWSNVGLGILTATYWWIFHGIFTEPEHIIGHGEYLDVTKLTDAQLGQFL